MTEHDAHLEELARQCANVTPLGRLTAVEQLAVFRWLIDGGHMTRTGKPLQRPRPAPQPLPRNNPDGTPRYAPGTDFSTHDTVVMPGAAKPVAEAV